MFCKLDDNQSGSKIKENVCPKYPTMRNFVFLNGPVLCCCRGLLRSPAFSQSILEGRLDQKVGKFDQPESNPLAFLPIEI